METVQTILPLLRPMLVLPADRPTKFVSLLLVVQECDALAGASSYILVMHQLATKVSSTRFEYLSAH
jgi:hypothetical protein